jgi:outer membrane protein OmpA-like peptidoglycan-associated protein
MRGQAIVVTLPEAMLFEPGSAMVKNSALDWISAVSRSLQDYPASRASIRGFTDNTGVPAEAQRLSEERARAVTRVLIATGTNSSRLTYAGVGAGNPVASNTTEAGRNQNRRIEVIISPEV